MFYQRSDLHEKEDFSEDIKKLTKKYVVSIINQIYDEFGCNEMEMTRDWGEPAERRVMDGSGILWKTFHHLDDYDFRKEKGIDYVSYHITDKPEEFADYILKFPEIAQTFVSEVKSYNFEF